jgi:peptide deformylase
MLKIVQAPESVLAQQAKEVSVIDKSIKNLLKEMEIALGHASDPEGVGLAAPQIGKSLQIFIIRETPDSPLLTFINPKIESFFEEPKKSRKERTQAGKKKGVQLEGCLSLKDIWGVVKRHFGVELSYLDENGKKHTQKFNGFLATIIQHEFDHLQGFLFTKRVLEQKNQLYRSIKNNKGETEFEEISL